MKPINLSLMGGSRQQMNGSRSLVGSSVHNTAMPERGKRQWINWLAPLGPGIITAALVFGPSKITITSKLGAEYGYSLIWAIVAAIFFMALYTGMAARVGLATESSFLTVVRQKWGRLVAKLAGFGVFLVAASFQAGNSVGVGISLAEPFHTSPIPWIVFFNVVGIILLFFRDFYKTLEKLMIGLVLMILVAFLTTVFLVKPDWPALGAGLAPSVPKGSLPLLIALFASSFSIVGALYQTYLVQERRRVSPHIRLRSRDSLYGIIILGIMAVVVLICAAAVLYPRGMKLTSAGEMSHTLEPLFGKNASYFFLIGLFGASFSSLVGNASVGGTLMADGLGWGQQLNSARTKRLIALVMISGATVAILFGGMPLQLIVLAQSATILVVPFLGVAIYIIANDHKIMGKYVNKGSMKFFGFAGIVLLFLLALMNVKSLFFN